MPADLPLIAWAEVPEGPVWFRHYEATGKWWAGLKVGNRLLDDSGSHLCFPSEEPCQFVFCAAEQQPGEWAAERARQADLIRQLDTDRVQARATLTRLRDGLAALEQGGFIRHLHSCEAVPCQGHGDGTVCFECPKGDGQCDCGLDDRLAALGR